jgi:hypothetical protein
MMMERDGFDIERVTFSVLGNYPSIADSVPRSYMGDESTGPLKPVYRNRLPTNLSCDG